MEASRKEIPDRLVMPAIGTGVGVITHGGKHTLIVRLVTSATDWGVLASYWKRMPGLISNVCQRQVVMEESHQRKCAGSISHVCHRHRRGRFYALFTE